MITSQNPLITFTKTLFSPQIRSYLQVPGLECGHIFGRPPFNPLGSLGGSVGKESACNAGDTGDVGLIPESGRSPGEGHGNPLQYSCLENPMDRGAWRTAVLRVAKSQMWLKRLSMHACIHHTHCVYTCPECLGYCLVSAGLLSVNIFYQRN